MQNSSSSLAHFNHLAEKIEENISSVELQTFYSQFSDCFITSTAEIPYLPDNDSHVGEYYSVKLEKAQEIGDIEAENIFQDLLWKHPVTDVNPDYNWENFNAHCEVCDLAEIATV